MKLRLGSMLTSLLCLMLMGWTPGIAQAKCPTNKTVSGSLFGTKIVGGKPAPWGRYPYLVSLRSRSTRSHYCGGTLIQKDLVLTAAHCVHPDVGAFAVHPFLSIGGTELRDDPDAEEIESCRTFIHSKYDYNNKVSPYDIALIQLSEDSYKQPCKIGFAASGQVKAVGWGRDRGTRLTSREANEIDLDIVRLNQCKSFDATEYKNLLTSQMCAKADNGDVCQGDSGGPLLLLGDGCGEKDSLLGLVSFGEICFDFNKDRRFTEFPGVYTRASSFRNWISSLNNDTFIHYKNPSCTRDPPKQSRIDREISTSTPDSDGDPLILNDERGCFFVEGIDFAKGIDPINNGKEDVTETPEECCDLCKKTPGCRAWTYFRVKEKYSPKGACWLRSIVPPPSRCTVCTSGLVKPEFLKAPEEECKVVLGMDLQGSDLWAVKVSKVQDCCERCKKQPRCASFTFTKDDNRCYLKSGVGQLAICSRCQSGILPSRVKETDDINVISALIQGTEQVFQSLKQTTIPGPCRLSIGMDMKSVADLTKENIPLVTTPEECCNLCKETKDCRSWTMLTVPTKYHPQAGQCFMRSTVPEEVPCAACTSGVVEGQGNSGISDPNCGLLEGVDFEKEDLNIPAPVTISPKECCDTCGKTSGCKSWTRTKLDGKCYMKKSGAPVIKLCTGCDSGVRLDKVTAAEIASLNPVLAKT